MSLAAALTDLQIEYVDGVNNVDNRTLPPGGKKSNLALGPLGNWRAHMNIARMSVCTLSSSFIPPRLQVRRLRPCSWPYYE